MAITYTQTDTTTDCEDQTACATGTVGSTTLTTELIEGASGGTTEQSADIPSDSSRLVVFMQTSGGVGATTWESGTYVPRWNVTTSQMDTAITGVWICRMDSTCTNQATVASNTSLNKDISGGGVFSENLTGTSQSASETDDIFCITEITNSNTHSSRSVGITPDQNFDTPIVINSTVAADTATSTSSAVSPTAANVQTANVAAGATGSTAISPSATFTETFTVTWETTTDWDAAQSETGTHHEQPSGTDWAASDTVEKGWKTTDEGDSSLEGYWPCDEDSGSTFTDVTANGNDMSVGADVSVGASGVLNTTCGSYSDLTNSYANTTGVGCNTDRYTGVVWLNYTSNDGDSAIIHTGPDETTWPSNGWTINTNGTNDQLALWHHSDGNNNNAIASSFTLSTDTWYMVVGQTDGAVNDCRLRIYDNTGQVSNETGTATRGTETTTPVTLGQGNTNAITAEIEEVRVYSRELSKTELDNLHGAML